METTAMDRLIVQQARELRARGYGICWLLPGEKNPTRRGWTLASQEPEAYRPGQNLGLMTGRVSGDLVLADLDSAAAIDAADAYLPSTGMTEGRASKPRSHRYYKVTGIPHDLVSTAAGGMGGPRIIHYPGIVDLLGTGAQAVCPPSRHASGEFREWHGGSMGEPAKVDCGELYEAVRRLAIACGWKPQPSSNGRAHGSTSSNPIMDRARRYLAAMPPAVSGEGGSCPTFRAACVLVIGFNLPEGQAFELLQEYSDRCQPPWSEKELWHKIRDAAKRPGERGYLLASFTHVPQHWCGVANCAEAAEPAVQPDGKAIILAHFRAAYQPAFRRGTAIYSSTHGRETKRSEAVAGANSFLIEQLAVAADAPRNNDGTLRRSALPLFFRNWAPTAWADLLAELSDEEAGAEISEPAREQFRHRVSSAFAALVSLGYQHANTNTVDVERRTIADWAKRFAKPGRWQSVRGYRLWCRRDGDGRLRIAFRVELFTQIPGAADLAFYGQRKLADLAEKYDVGCRTEVQGGNARAIELDQRFVEELFAEPMLAEPGQTDVDSLAHVREENFVREGGQNGDCA